MIKKSFLLLHVSIAALMLTACSEPEPEVISLIRVRVQPLSELLVDYDYSAAAQALSLRDSEIPAEISANIKAITALVGATVVKNDVLIELDCRDSIALRDQSEATLDALKAREALAKKQYQRAKSLRASRSVSEDELSQKKSVMDAAQAERIAQISALEMARHNVDRCAVRAPFGGVITARYVEIGEHVTKGMPLLRLVDHENLELHAQISADDADSLSDAENPVFTCTV